MPSTVARVAQRVLRFTRAHLAAVVGVLLTAGLGWFCHSFPPGATLRHKSYDLLHIWRGDVAVDEAVVVYLDDESYRELEQPYNAPWDRRLHAKLVDRLTRGGAKAIAFDVIFSDPVPAADPAFAAAIKRHGNVILAADNIRLESGDLTFVRACDELLEAAGDKLGSAERLPDPDLVVRRHTPKQKDSVVSMLSWVTAESVGAPITKVPGAELQMRWMNYYGRPYVTGKGNVISGLSYRTVLKADDNTDLGVSNKVVYVGAKIFTKFAGDRKDEFPSPWGSFEPEPVFMTGVEIQATEMLNLIRGDWLRRLPFRTEEWLILLLGALIGGGLVFLRPAAASGVAALLVGLLIWICLTCFTRNHLWFPWMIVALQVMVALAWSVFFNSVQLYVQKRLFEHTLGLYLSPKLVAKFSSSPALLKPGAEKHQLTLLFSDIADFTKISEKMDSDELAAMMNEYFQGAVGSCVHRTDGTVVKYIGDAIFALWNAPEFQPDHAARACAAALHFRELSKQPVRGHSLNTRIGLHTGVANVGNFGSEDRVDYTAIGESVNLASRMEGLNKYLGTNCLISGATKKEVGETFVTRRVGLFQLKGYEGLVEVHELVGFPEQAEESRAWREAFATALAHFERRDLVSAQPAFRHVLALKPDDGPTKHYLSRLAEILAEADPNWPTHTVLKEK